MDLLAFYQLAKVNAISLTPSLAKQLIGLKQFTDLDLNQITLGGEIADQTLLNRLKLAFPQSRLSHVYATTETGSLFSVSDGIAGFPASMLDRPIGNGSHSLQIDQGFLVIKEIASGKTWESGDSVDLETENDRVVFTGRQQQVVKVGGRKVYLEKVRSAICSNSGVVDAVVYSVSNPFLGHTVEANVWLTSENSQDRLALLSRLGEQLEKWEKPVRVNWVQGIELSPNGKMGLRNA
jgi:acyl-CoA synthetase (AMP-forming)/AMP-acid ligase II